MDYLEMYVDRQLKMQENSVPLLKRIKEKFRRKITNATNIDENTKYKILTRLEAMKNHAKLCHGDFNPSNIIIDESNVPHIIDWSHVTSGNSSADAARTFLLFSIEGKEKLAALYLELYSKKSGIELKYLQEWIPIVAATQMTKGKTEEQAFLSTLINVVEY